MHTATATAHTGIEAGIDAGISKVPWSRFSDVIYTGLKKSGIADKKFEIFNLSLEDLSSSVTTFVSVYSWQAVTSIREHKHVYETNGRNALIWVTSLGVRALTKNPTFSVNTLAFNHFMKDARLPQVSEEMAKNGVALDQLPKRSLGQLLLSPFRLHGMTDKATGLYYPADYFHLLKRAGVHVESSDRKQSFWNVIDLNDSDKAIAHFNKLEKELKAQKALSTVDRLHLKMIPSFIRRKATFDVIASAIITLASAYVVGKLVMDVVFKYIAPRDPDFDASKYVVKKKGKRVQPQTATPFATGTHAPSMAGQRRYPSTFSAPVLPGSAFSGTAATLPKPTIRPSAATNPVGYSPYYFSGSLFSPPGPTLEAGGQH